MTNRLFAVRTAVLLLAVAAVVTPAPAHEAPTAGFGVLSGDASQETAQFRFLVGEWNCSTRWMSPDGSLSEGPKATWTGYWILDGHAIQDDWTSTGPDGKPSFGTNIRSFNPESRKWDNRWLAAGSLQWKYFEAEQVGETMVMTGEGADGQGREFVDHNTFYEIEKGSWKWRKDRSYDGGENWIEGIGYIHCTSAGGAAPGDS